MATLSPYRMLPAEKRTALLTHAIRSTREARAVWVRKLAAQKGGYRVATLQQWPPEQLAREIVRRRAESADDEYELLHLLYVELEPEVQGTFLDAAGVPNERGHMPDDLAPPFADAEGVRRGAAAVRERHGAAGDHYLRTIGRYSSAGWPGIEEVVATLEEP